MKYALVNNLLKIYNAKGRFCRLYAEGVMLVHVISIVPRSFRIAMLFTVYQACESRGLIKNMSKIIMSPKIKLAKKSRRK